jgi:hypothetical protein
LQNPNFAGLQFLTGIDDIGFPSSFLYQTPYIPSYTLKKVTTPIEQSSTDVDKTVPVFKNYRNPAQTDVYFSRAFTNPANNIDLYKFIDTSDVTSCD